MIREKRYMYSKTKKIEKHDIMKIARSTYRNGHDEKPKKKEWKQSDNEYEGP